MPSNSATVYVIDNDKQSRESICNLVRSMHFQAKSFESAEAFLDLYDAGPGCVVADYRLMGMNGIELQEELLARNLQIPLILISAFARTAVTVRAIQNGAVTMLDKPCSEDELWNAIREALALDEKRRAKKQDNAEIARRLESLNSKEKQVLDLVVAGESNKAMANKLDVSLRTIETRRRSVFSKLGAENVAELVAMVLKQQID